MSSFGINNVLSCDLPGLFRANVSFYPLFLTRNEWISKLEHQNKSKDIVICWAFNLWKEDIEMTQYVSLFFVIFADVWISLYVSQLFSWDNQILGRGDHDFRKNTSLTKTDSDLHVKSQTRSQSQVAKWRWEYWMQWLASKMKGIAQIYMFLLQW